MMNRRLHDLEHALQVLALPVTFQMNLDVGAACRVNALKQLYDKARHMIARDNAVTALQSAILSELDSALALTRPFPECSDAGLRMNASWRRVRRLARESLASFGWPLRLPPDDANIYGLLKSTNFHVRREEIR
jgi:hypothetical protein